MKFVDANSAQHTQVLILPGLGNSGPQHWQSLWEHAHGYQRVEQTEWDQPKLADWLVNLELAVSKAHEGVVLVAHSLACSLVAHFAQLGGEATKRVRGAFLVSPADVESRRCTPPEVRCFSPIPLRRLPFPARVVSSSDDPYVERERAELFARSWGAEFVDVGCCGHINASSGLGTWPEGHQQFLACVAVWQTP
ncbi:MAG: alpha/beta hydrolase [Polyangiaceae bacterium]